MARPTLFSNRKLAKLAQRLQSRATAVGALELLWYAANETGNPVVGDADDVEALADWRGERGELVAALLEAGSNGCPGFIFSRDDGRFEIHDYWDHAPDYVRKRAKREAERRDTGDFIRKNEDSDRSERRIDKELTGQRPVSDQSVTGQNPFDSPQNSDFFRTPSPSPSPAPAPAPNEEKRVAAARLPPGGSRPAVDPEFGLFKSLYPKRSGNQPWQRARKAISARLLDGYTWQRIHDGTRRYAEWCKATGKIGTEHVMQAATFVGPDKSFLNSWELPASKADTRLAGNVDAAAQAKRELFGGES